MEVIADCIQALLRSFPPTGCVFGQLYAAAGRWGVENTYEFVDPPRLPKSGDWLRDRPFVESFKLFKGAGLGLLFVKKLIDPTGGPPVPIRRALGVVVAFCCSSKSGLFILNALSFTARSGVNSIVALLVLCVALDVKFISLGLSA